MTIVELATKQVYDRASQESEPIRKETRVEAHVANFEEWVEMQDRKYPDGIRYISEKSVCSAFLAS